MTVDLSVQNILRRISVLFIYLLNIEVTLVNTALAEIKAAFPTADPTLISLVSTFPMMIMLGMSFFVVPPLAKRFDKKDLVLFAIASYCFGGVGAAFINQTIYHLIATRIFVGIGAGLSAPLCGAYINELYDGLDKKNMLGWANAVGSLMGAGITMAAGILCAIRWDYTFFAYGFFVIVFIMAALFLPSSPAPVSSGMDLSEKAIVRLDYTPKQKVKLFIVCLYGFLFLLCCMTLMVKFAIFVDEKKIGDPVVIATAMSILMMGILSASAVFGFAEMLFKRYTMVVSSGLAGIGVFIMVNSHTPNPVFISSYILGLGAGLNFPLLQTKALAIGPKKNGTFANAMVLGVVNSGQFLAAFSEKGVGLFIEPTTSNLLYFVVWAFVAITIASIVYIIVDPFKGVNYDPDANAAPARA